MSAADDFNKILFADAVLDLLAAKVVERLAATGGGQDKAAGIQVKVERVMSVLLPQEARMTAAPRSNR